MKTYRQFVAEMQQGIVEGTGVTDYNPKSQGGTRKELLAKYRETKDPRHAEAARRAGATQRELQAALKEDTRTLAITEMRHGDYSRKSGWRGNDERVGGTQYIHTRLVSTGAENPEDKHSAEVFRVEYKHSPKRKLEGFYEGPTAGEEALKGAKIRPNTGTGSHTHVVTNKHGNEVPVKFVK